MDKLEATRRLMELVSSDDDEPRQLPIDVDVGWTQRAKGRRVISQVLREWCPVFDIKGEFTEKKRWFSSTFFIVLTGSVRGLNDMSRVWETNIKLAWLNDTYNN